MGALSTALSASLRAQDAETVDRAAVALAKRYAAELDADSDLLPKLGPLLLAALVQLRLTPQSRAEPAKGGRRADAHTALDELRARRSSRQD